MGSEDGEDTDQTEFSVSYDVSPEQVRSEVASMIERGDVSEEDIEASPEDLLDDLEKLATDLAELAPDFEEYPSLVDGYYGDVTNLQENQEEWIAENATSEMIATVEKANAMFTVLLFRSQDLYEKESDEFSSEDLDFDVIQSKYPEIYNLWVIVPKTMSERAE